MSIMDFSHCDNCPINPHQSTTIEMQNGIQIVVPLVDMIDGVYYSESFVWAIENSIISVVEKTKIHPGERCRWTHFVSMLQAAATVCGQEIEYSLICSLQKYPNDCMNRAQLVFALWSAFCCPEPASTDITFTDVSVDAPYYRAVAWAVQNEIAFGITGTIFSPSSIATLGFVVTSIHKCFLKSLEVQRVEGKTGNGL